MLKPLCIFLLLLLSGSLLSQEIERIRIEGKVTAPLGEDVEGVSIYNVSSQQGTITSPNGNFELPVAEHDRISISALQFSTFTVIVDEGVLNTGKMRIYLNPVVNNLEEVIVRPYDLLGNITADVGRIKTADVVPDWDLTYKTIEFEYEFSDDRWSAVRGNAAEEALGLNSVPMAKVDLLKLIKMFYNPKTKSSRQRFAEKNLAAKGLRQRFSNSYLSEVFDIGGEEANDFIYFAEENGMHLDLLRASNEILLLNFMFEKSAAYKKQRGEN
jgi:hypothetical protein